jgi:hypothetical protein
MAKCPHLPILSVEQSNVLGILYSHLSSVALIFPARMTFTLGEQHLAQGTCDHMLNSLDITAEIGIRIHQNRNILKSSGNDLDKNHTAIPHS